MRLPEHIQGWLKTRSTSERKCQETLAVTSERSSIVVYVLAYVLQYVEDLQTAVHELEWSGLNCRSRLNRDDRGTLWRRSETSFLIGNEWKAEVSPHYYLLILTNDLLGI